MNRTRLLMEMLAAGAGLLVMIERSARTRRAASAAIPVPVESSTDAIDSYVERHRRRLRVPGAALGIVEGDRIVHLRGFGHAQPRGDAPSPQTPFMIGSTTKSFTALAVMQLVEAGKIELDGSVQRYLPWFKVADPDSSTRMTVRHLLNQTSGLPQIAGLRPLADLDQSPDARRRQARALATLVPARPPGAAWEYSNMNYNLLGLIIEAVTDASYEAYIRDHIFSPLGMRHSFTSRDQAQRNGLAVGHRYWYGVPVATRSLLVPRGSVPSGWLISSLQDMAQYLIAHLNEGRYRGTRILSPEGIAQLHRPVAPVEIMGKPAGAYGMGWIVEDIGRTKILWHDGVVPDFYAYMAIVPEQKKGVVLLLNADHLLMALPLREVGAGLARLLAGYEPAPIRLSFIPWVLCGLPLLPLLQLAGIVASLRVVRRWRRGPITPPRRDAWVRHVLLPLIPNLSFTLPSVIMVRTSMLPLMLLYVPDVARISVVCGLLALVWAPLRAGLAIWALRKWRR